MLYSGLARLIGFVPQVLATALTVALIINHFGVDAYATYALVFSLFGLIPLNNLGVGGSVTQAIAAYGVDDDRSIRTGVTGSRVLLLSGLFVVVVALIFGLLGLWPGLLGQSSANSLNLAVTGAVALYGLTFVPFLAQNVLLAVGRNHLSVFIASFVPVSAVVLVGTIVVTDASSWTLLLVPSAALIVVGLVTLVVSARTTGYPWRNVLAKVPFRRRYPGIRIRSLSLPLMITSVTFPIAFAGDRIILSHFGTQQELAGYALVIQIFMPVTTLLQAAAQPLWPMVTAARMQGTKMPNIKKVLGVFLIAAVVINVPLVIACPWLADLISGGDIEINHQLPILGAALTTMSAIAFPLGMSMVDPEGARFTATCAVLAVPISIVSSILFARELGGPGLFISALIVGAAVQVIPAAIFIYRRGKRAEDVVLL